MEAVPEVPAVKGWTIDKRQAIGAALGLLCLGILIGFKLGSGSEPLVIEKPVFVQKDCADCADKAKAKTAEPQESVPGDSSIPGD